MPLRDAIYGAAIGDALGVPFEFNGRDSFTCKDMVSGGVHNQPVGTYSDDTCMILATCDSIRENGAVRCEDMREKFKDWAYRGKYAPGGVVFDIGGTTSLALANGRGFDGERDNGNGSLMRIIPLAFTDATDDEVRAVSAITHAHQISMDACVKFVHIARFLIDGLGKEEAVAGMALPDDIRDVKSGGYVLDTLNAALWCLLNTESYKSCVLSAVNLGKDTDTTACVAGALAGIYYGYEDIPAEWIEKLRGKEIIDCCLF